MPNLIKTLDSGATLEIQLAPFELGNELRKVVLREIAKIDISFGEFNLNSLGAESKLKDFIANNMNDQAFNTVKNVVATLASSEEIERVLWKCFQYSLYNKKKIVVENNIFEDEVARGDYFIVAKEVLVFNISPFLKGLVSQLSALIAQKAINAQR